MSTLELDARKALAVSVFASLNGESPQAIRMLSRALGMADEPLAQIGRAFDFWADALEIPDCTGGLAVIVMARALHVAARHPDAPALLDRLEQAEGAPWPQLRDALHQVWTARQLRQLDANEGEPQ